MPGGDGPVVQGSTRDLWKVQQADEVGDSASVLAETLCELVLGRPELGEVVAEGESDLHCCAIVEVADCYRNFFQTNLNGSLEAAFPSDDLESVVSWAHDDGFEDAMFADTLA